VARTLKFVFCGEPTRRAAQVRALCEQRKKIPAAPNTPPPVRGHFFSVRTRERALIFPAKVGLSKTYAI